MLRTHRKLRYAIVFAIIGMAFAAVVIASLHSWVSVRKAFSELNATYIPILGRASGVSLSISQARTELFRYVNGYEPSPTRIQKSLNQVRTHLLWISRQQIPQNSKDFAGALLTQAGQFQAMLNLLESQMNTGDSIHVLLTADRLTGSATTLSSLAGKLRVSLWDQILNETEASQKSLLRNNAIVAGVSLGVILILVAGVLFYNLFLKKQVQARTAELKYRLHDLHESQRALEESERRNRQIFNTMSEGLVIVGQGGEILFINSAFRKMYGYSQEELIGEHPLKFIHPDYHHVFERFMEELAQEGRFSGETVDIHKDGTTFHTDVQGARIQVAGRECFLAVIRDVTDRKQAEEELQKLAMVVEHSSELVNLATLEGKMIFLNEAGSKMLGIGPDEIERTHIMEVIPHHLQELVRHEVLPTLLGGKTWEGNLQYRNIKTGKLTDVHAMTFPVQEPNTGMPLFLANVSLDITERKRAEEEKRILEAQLRQAHKMEAIGTLAGGIAHDFNNILAALIGYTEMALEDAEEGSLLQQNLREVLIAGNRAKGLVKQILAFSRQTDQESKPVQIRPIAKEALRLLRATLPATIEIRQDIRSDSAVRANPTHVHQVLINLCTNAAQAMEEKGGTLEVMLVDVVIDADFAHDHPDVEPGPYVRLSVTDTGHGMTPEVMDRIFDPFFTTREVGQGTGMGLSVAHGIVSGCGGAITVASEPGEGSTFDVYLPVIEREEEQETSPEGPLPWGTERILFIDDEETLANMGKQMLESLGYEVTASTDGMEALELFRSQPDGFDLVITDMTMPKVTGADLAKDIMGIRPDIPIVLCTGFSATMDEKRAETMGIKAFVFKPVLKGKMAMTIRQLLDSQKEKAGQPRPRVLVIDDDVGIRTMLRRLLEGAGYEVTEAPDGSQGIYLYRQDPLDLVITDIIMPEKEGLETIRELRRDFPKVKIVAISGGGRIRADEYLPVAEQLGADRTLAKPFDPKELLDAVHELVG